MDIVAIWAYCYRDNDKVIGIDGKIPWHFSSDLKRFKHITTGGVLVVGRKTYETFPNRTLPDRKIVVISRDENYKVSDPKNHYLVNHLDWLDVVNNYEPDFLDEIFTGATQDVMYIAGGAEIYKLFFEHPTLYPDYVIESDITDLKVSEKVKNSKGKKEVLGNYLGEYLPIIHHYPDDKIINYLYVRRPKSNTVAHLEEAVRKSFSSNTKQFMEES